MTGFGDFVNVDDDARAKGYDYTTGGLTVGIDYRLTDHFVVGIMGGYAHTWNDLKPTGSLDVDSGWGGIYAGYFTLGADSAVVNAGLAWLSLRLATPFPCDFTPIFN